MQKPRKILLNPIYYYDEAFFLLDFVRGIL